MSVDRPNSAALGRLCESSRAPMYALDASRKLLYANAALAAWAGVPVRELLGLRCPFGDDPAASPLERIAAALGPDPLPAERRDVVGRIAHPARPAEVRSVRWIALTAADDEPVGTLGVMSSSAEPAPSNADIESPIDAHAELLAYRAAAHDAFGFERLVGESPAIRLAAARIALFAPLDAPLWICGPRGSGRRAIARAIHQRGREPERALIEIDAGLSTPEVFAARLRGLATSGESARGGTLLVLRIEDLDHDSRRRLLGFLRKHPAWRLIATASRTPTLAGATSDAVPGAVDRELYDLCADRDRTAVVGVARRRSAVAGAGDRRTR
ncbi:MAG: sigma 54-interacting transcriptional regulator [Pirellulales bacterium]